MHSSYVLPATTPSANERLSLISVINFVLRNAVLIVLVGVVFAIPFAIKSAMAPPTYTASTSFITEGEPAPGRLISFGGVTLSGGSGKSPSFYIELMRTPIILGPLVEMPFQDDPDKPPRTLIERYGGGQPRAIAMESAMNAMKSRLRTRVSFNDVITLSVTAEHPRLAANIAQGFLDQIDLFNNNKRRSQASAERKFAEQRLVEIGADVREAERAYQIFLERNRNPSLSPALSIERDRLTSELAIRRELLGTVRQGYERAKMDEVRSSPQATIVASPTVPLGADPKSTTRNAILGFFLGAVLATLAALVREYFRRVRGESTPEASEFLRLQSKGADVVRRPVTAFLGMVRKPRSFDEAVGGPRPPVS